MKKIQKNLFLHEWVIELLDKLRVNQLPIAEWI